MSSNVYDLETKKIVEPQHDGSCARVNSATGCCLDIEPVSKYV